MNPNFMTSKNLYETVIGTYKLQYVYSQLFV